MATSNKVFFITYDGDLDSQVHITYISPEFINDNFAMRDIVLSSVPDHRKPHINKITLFNGHHGSTIYEKTETKVELDEALFKI